MRHDRVSARLRTARERHEVVCFDRAEMRVLLDFYSRRVVGGEWRDYALDQGGERAVFSVFRHSLALPLYSIEKLARGGGYRLWCRGRRLAQSGSIADLLKTLDGRPRLVVARL